jgi:hypothetical protein
MAFSFALLIGAAVLGVLLLLVVILVLFGVSRSGGSNERRND